MRSGKRGEEQGMRREKKKSTTDLPHVTSRLPGIAGKIKAVPHHFVLTELDGPLMKADEIHDKDCCHVVLTVTREGLNA